MAHNLLFSLLPSPSAIFTNLDSSSERNRKETILQQVTPTVGPAEQRFDAVLLLNAEGKKNAPTVLTPHGGPHSAFPAVYLLSNAYLNLLGYDVIQVNYR